MTVAPTTPPNRGIAVVTGASSGIGAATAVALSQAGFEVVLAARRLDRLREVAERCPGPTMVRSLDVTDDGSVADLAASLDGCRVLVNNAGGALGLDPIADADLDQWRTMYDTNLLGTLRVTRALLPALEASGDGHVVLIGSIAGIEPYPGGAGYNGAKAAQHAFAEVLRRETVGLPIRVSEVQPGLVDTEFSLVRFAGDEARAAAVYEGLTPLYAEDVADVVAFIVTRPSHVNIATTLLLPRDQATATVTHREQRPKA
jgi:NADP-dependent 3-hydroxy acid dehydrogenase YdfG